MKLKDKIVKNRVGILIFIGVLLVVTIIIGISYAYFFNIEIKNNNTISGNINTSPIINVNTPYPAANSNPINDKISFI